MQLDLSNLQIEGAFASSASTSSGCPLDARVCQGLACGKDYFGVDCDAYLAPEGGPVGCGKGLTCSTGECVVGGCDPESTTKVEGTPIGDQDYKDENNATWNLHSQCGVPAVWMIETAFWCSACTYLAPSFQALFDKYSPLGVKFVLLVGETNSGGPTTAIDAKNYKIQHGYQDGWIALADPHWALTENVIAKTSNYVPNHAILDKDLILRQASANSDSVWAEETALLQILKRAGLVP